jgi:site-specific recombinase XerD
VVSQAINPITTEAAGSAADAVTGYVAASRAPATRQAYASDWADFAHWCAAHGHTALPATPSTVAEYIAERADTLRPVTIGRRLSSIAFEHGRVDVASPTSHPQVRAVYAGIRRSHGTAADQRAAAVTGEVIKMTTALPTTLAGTRDRAILLLGFAGAFRRSELVSLNVDDLTVVDQGLIVRLRRSKSDQEGASREVGIPRGSAAATCPVEAVVAWLATADINSGPVFRAVTRYDTIRAARLSPASVARIVKQAAAGAGLDAGRYAAHSLRSGLATSAAAAGVDERTILEQTRHRNPASLRPYIRRGQLFTSNAAAAVGL